MLSIRGQRQGSLRIVLLVPLGLRCPCSRTVRAPDKRVALGVDQALDLHRHLHVAAAIEPLAGSAFVGLQLRKLRLPEAQDVSLHAAELRDISNFEVEAIRDRRWLVGALPIDCVAINCGEATQQRGKSLALLAV